MTEITEDVAVLKAQRDAHEQMHSAFEKSIDGKMEEIRKQHDACRNEVKAELNAGHQEFKNLRSDVGDIKTKVNLIYANGNGHSWKREWTIRIGTGGGLLTILLFLIQWVLSN